MGQIKKIISMCPAPQGWKVIYDGGEWEHVAVWVLVQLEDSSQTIVAMTNTMPPFDLIDRMNWQVEHCECFEFNTSEL
jgi:hypothetical protein